MFNYLTVHLQQLFWLCFSSVALLSWWAEQLTNMQSRAKCHFVVKDTLVKFNSELYQDNNTLDKENNYKTHPKIDIYSLLS